jgi:hypothetical protein
LNIDLLPLLCVFIFFTRLDIGIEHRPSTSRLYFNIGGADFTGFFLIYDYVAW